MACLVAATHGDLVSATAGYTGALPRLVPMHGRRHLLLDDDVRVHGSKGDSWLIRRGFTTDLASVPQVFQWLVDDREAYWLAALVHDYLCAIARGDIESCRDTLHPLGTCACKGSLPRYVNRRDADGVFRVLLRVHGASAPVRDLQWAAVRIASKLEGGMSGDDWLRMARVLPLGLLVVLFTLPPMLGRLIVHRVLAPITDRLER